MNGQKNDILFFISLALLLFSYSLIGNSASFVGVAWLEPINLSNFAIKPDKVSHYTLRFHELDGVTFGEPLPFRGAAEVLGVEDVVEGEELINRLGIALHQEDEAEANSLHNEIIELYLAGHASAEYEILFLAVNPVERYSWETDVSEKTIGLFTYPDDAIQFGTGSEIAIENP